MCHSGTATVARPQHSPIQNFIKGFCIPNIVLYHYARKRTRCGYKSRRNSSQTRPDQWFVEELCTHAYKDRVFTPVAAKLFGLIAQHHAERLDLLNKDRYRFVTSALFLGEVYHQVKIGKSPFRVLVGPVLKYLDMIIEPHLAGDSNENVDDDMIVVSKQLLQSGVDLHESKADAVEALVLKVTEVFCRCQLTAATRLNLVAALADLWPLLAKGNISLRTQHASLAAKLGVSLHI
ncbi:putative CBP80/20-dependent translation initiation factor-like 2 [Homarus americanus]|uniref:Putative CBP80/20-dependent translation initiation factor-like 2 n=1 Tax=Homarus americanus TaxID=6706 RepID=A0A8J5JSR6_HOMAM|nr:putative CBP80/20-dependent translation initiation factor-like 2 [Homarus americanus]